MGEFKGSLVVKFGAGWLLMGSHGTPVVIRSILKHDLAGVQPIRNWPNRFHFFSLRLLDFWQSSEFCQMEIFTLS
jgi:hypothetical protein